MKRPDPIHHMMMWGFVGGFAIGISYMMIIYEMSSGTRDPHFLIILINPFAWILTTVTIILPCTMVGSFLGMVLERLLKHAPIPFTKIAILSRGLLVYSSAFFITLLMGYMLYFFYYGGLQNVPIVDIAPLLAAIGSTYAAHRYMFRLRLWSANTTPRKIKEKAKHAETRLTGDVDYDDIIGEMEEIADYQKQDYS